MAGVSVRYIVNDVDAAIVFYTQRLGFQEVMHPAPTFAMLSRGDLRLVLSAPGGGPGGGQAMPDGTVPTPGGWNRFSIEVDDLDALVAELRGGGRALPQRHRRRCRRKADPARGPVGQPGRAVPADDSRSLDAQGAVAQDLRAERVLVFVERFAAAQAGRDAHDRRQLAARRCVRGEEPRDADEHER